MGIALNYETDLKYFDLINPCGLEGKKVTSMAKILGTEISRTRLLERITFHFKQIFERNWEEKRLEEVLNRETQVNLSPSPPVGEGG